MRTKADSTPTSSSGNLVEEAIAFSTANYERNLDEVIEFISIPSIGTSPEYRESTLNAARWLSNSMENAGLENVTLIETDDQPLVYGDWLHAGADKPTVLIYGHYDVQPADPIEEWNTPPFQPTIVGDYIYGRGTSDDKCQLYIYIKCIEALMNSAGSLPLNVKCIFEGEEEFGGLSIEKFVKNNPVFLAADAAVLSDTQMINPDQPAIMSAIRGICYIMLDIYGPSRDLHSGSFGGVIDNPINAISHIISSLKDPQGRILVPGFYEDVRNLSDAERQILNDRSISAAEILELTGAPAVWGEPECSIVDRIGSRPTLDVHGIIGGYTDEGEKTIIPAHVHAKISMRLVADQDGNKIYQSFKEYVQKLTPPTVTVKVKMTHQASPTMLDIGSEAAKAAENAYNAVFNRKPKYVMEGGSIPVVAAFKEHLLIDTIMMGFGLPDDKIHSPNERFYLPNFQRGIETVIRFMDNYGNGHLSAIS